MDSSSRENQNMPLPGDPHREPRSASHTVGTAPVLGLAVVSLSLGVMSLMSALLVIPALCAIITGHLAMHKIRHTNRELGGHRLALTGTIMGYVSVMMFSLILISGILLWPKFGSDVKDFLYEGKQVLEEQKLAKPMRNASELFLLCERYARDHNDAYPKTWQDLEKGYSNAVDLKKWLSSAHTNDPAYYPAFDLVPHERPVFESAKNRVAVIQGRAPASVAQVVVVFADGHSEPMPNPAHE